MSQPVYSVSATSALGDDFILTSDVLVDTASTAPVAVFNVGGVPQALFVRADGVLCQISPTIGASQAGWATVPVGSTAGVTGVVAGIQSDGTVHAFYTDASATRHISLSNGQWSAPDPLALLSSVAITVNGTTGELVAYGIDGDNLALIRQQGPGETWSLASMPASGSLAGTAPVLVLTDAADDWIMATPGSSGSKTGLQLYQGSATAIVSGPQLVTVPNAVKQVVLGYYANNAAQFLFVDSKNGLYSTIDGAQAAVQIAGGTVANAAAVIDESNMLHVYAAGPDGSVSALHQTGWSYGGPSWAPMIPLDSGLQALFTDSSLLDVNAFFAIDTESVLWHYVQDAATQHWVAAKAQTPGVESYRVPQYRTDLTIIDENGSPAANVAFSVTASIPGAVLHGGLLYPIGPTTPLAVTTNPLGRATLSSIASGLSAPSLTVSLAGVDLLAGINPASEVHGFLSGQNSSLNEGSASAFEKPFDGPTIQAGTVGGTPIAPATQDGQSGLALANTASGGIQQLFQVKVPGNTVTPPSADVIGFAVDMSDRLNPKLTLFHSEEEYQLYRSGDAGMPQAAFDSDWWDSVKDFFGDVWHGIKQGVIAVTKFVVHIADKVIDLAVQVYDEVKNIVGAAINGIEDIVAAIHGIFAWIGAELERLVDWLKMLFDWGDIMNTSSALQSALGRVFPYVQDVITQKAEPLVAGFFSKLEGQVTASFDAAAASYRQSGAALPSLVPSGSSRYAPAVGLSLGASTGTMALADFKRWEGSVHNNWLIEKLEALLGLQPSLPVVDALAGDFANLTADFDTVADDFLDALENFASFFTTALSDPKDLSTIGVADLIEAAKDVALAVLTFLDGIIESLLALMATAVGAAGNVVTAPLDIPFFTSMFDEIASLFDVEAPDFSVSGLFCTAIAIPITILYKIANGSSTQPFPGGTLPTADALHASLASDALGSAASLGIQYTAAGIASLWALMDTGLDCVPTCELMVFQILDLVAPSLLTVFTWPGGIPFEAPPFETSEDKASFANWIIGICPVIIGIATLSAGKIKWSETSNVPRYIDPAGKILLTAFGTINLVSGIVAASLGANGGNIAGDIVGPLPVLCQFLRLDSLQESSEGLTLAIKLVIDFFAGEGLAVAIAAS